MNQITPESKLPYGLDLSTPRRRLRPLQKSPSKSSSIGKPVEGNVGEVNPNPRSITGNLGLSEIGTSTRPDQSGVTVQPQSPSPPEKGDPEMDKEPSKPKIPSATP